MAVLCEVSTGVEVILFEQHIFGRHPSTFGTQLVNPEASRIHAAVNWDGSQWSLRDLSSNGTIVNGRVIETNIECCLNVGDEIQFGGNSAGRWRVNSLEVPKPRLVPVTEGLDTYVLDGNFTLPSEDVLVNLYLGFNGRWFCESEHGAAPLENGDIVGSTNKQWLFVDVTVSSSTSVQEVNFSGLESTTFQFVVSQDEEHVSIEVNQGGNNVKLGERSHHYLLLLLARKKREDKARGLAERECGWIHKDLLSRMLGMDDAHINIQIYRIRKQLGEVFAGLGNVIQPIERRSGEVRFAYDDIHIEGGLNNDTDLSQPSSDLLALASQ